MDKINRVQNQGKAIQVSVRTKTHEKGMNPSLIPSSYG